ncbi:WD40/YVTN/BNR-like repeat-containing protein [Natrarchaeobius oligotrophus]|uniref:Glycosyl hydrolase n=1 Tax=Natrarchaeobius chitinivorans TaxID=1679083 RepID=A0A3N6MDB0_NATCH|nr:hypothetical protein [Natrarchaeobius chitinivorans]RQH01924.1 hypothetical protein EA472_06360 [Natrarchaeobius chitinivorans]
MPTAYVALADRLLDCRDGTGTGEWTTRAHLEGRRLECVAVSPDEPNRVFAGTFESGLFRRTDRDGAFDRLETPFESQAVTALAISPHDAETVYAGTEPSRVYRSRDGGDSWEHLDGLVDLPSEPEWYFPPRPHTHHVRWLAVDPFDPDRLYVGIEAGAFVLSTDGGETWRERPEGSRRDNHSLTTHPDREGLVYAAAGDGFAVSTDGGERWHRPQSGLDHRYCWSVVADPANPDAVLVSSASGASSAHRTESAESSVYRRRDGDDWSRLDDRGLPTGEGVVRAVFATTDFGDSWSELPVAWSDDLTEKTPRGLAVLA